MSDKEKSDKQKEEEQMIREIEAKIEDVIDLLSLQKDFHGSKRDLEKTLDSHQQSRNNKELTYMRKDSSKHKHVAITKHAQGNMDLVEAMKMHKRFSEHPIDLLSHLDTLTDKLVLLIQRQGNQSNNKRKRV